LADGLPLDVDAKAVRRKLAVDNARKRRVAQADRRQIRVISFLKKANKAVKLTLQQRVTLAANYLRDQVVRNLSTPVEKIVTKKLKVVKGKDGQERLKLTYRVKVDPKSRSKPGEFPRADTTLLMKSIFYDVKEVGPGSFEAKVGTALDYGLILEISEELDRSFLVRTLNKEAATVTQIITKGSQQ